MGVDAFKQCRVLVRLKFPHISIRINNIIRAGQSEIVNKIYDTHDIEWRNGELSILAAATREERRDYNRWDAAVKPYLNRIVRD